MASIERVVQVFEWCARSRDDADAATWFADDFVFDNGVEVHDRASFIQRRNISAGHTDIKVLHALRDDSVVSVLFECVDGATRIEMHAAWFVRFEGDRIAKITSVHNFSSWPPQAKGG
jgi:hypothetical protein